MIELINGECLEEMDKLIERGVVVDAIITDPPYGTTACKWDSVIPFDAMWERLNKLIKPNGAVVLFGSEPFSSALRMSNIKNYRYDWIWQKSKPTGHLNAKKRPMLDHEVLCVFYRKLCCYNPQGVAEVTPRRITRSNIGGVYNKAAGMASVQTHTGYPRSVLSFGIEEGLHPTQKPVALMEYLIKTYTNEGDTVLDFTMGSGTTGVACHNTGRNFIGIELDSGYFKVAQDRIYNNKGGNT